MKKTVLRYGGIAAVICAIIAGGSNLLLGQLDYRTSEILGWVAIILGLSMVFFGIRYYRDKQADGMITLGRSMQVGLLISLFPSMVFFLVTLIVMAFYGDEFAEYAIKHYQKTAPDRVDEIREQYESGIFSNPFISSLVMFFTVYLTGVVFSLISGLILKRKAGSK